MKFYLRYILGLFILFLISTHSHANVLFVTNTNDVGAGSLRNQVLAANNGDSIVFAVSGQVNILSPLIFNKTLIIIGATAKHNTIHFQGGNFQLNSAFTVVFQKLRFIENVTGDYRFTSSNSGDFEFYDCLFENFTDENNDGAVFSVHGAGTTLMVENCGFFSNTAVYNGGVLELFNQAFAQFRNCTFFDNTAAFGGVFFPNTNTTLHLINNTFLNNSSVLYNATANNTIVINNNIFSSPNPSGMLQGSSTWNNLGGNVYSSTSGLLNTVLLLLGINTSGDTYAGNQANIHLRATHVTDG